MEMDEFRAILHFRFLEMYQDPSQVEGHLCEKAVSSQASRGPVSANWGCDLFVM